MTERFNHALLLLARQYRDLSQADVASAAGLNQGHYSRIESGLLPDGPSHENVRKLAAALDFPLEFYFEPDGLSGLPLSVHPMTRKRASLGERTLKRVHAELNLRLFHLRRFLSAVDLNTELPRPWIDVDEGGGPQAIARTIRRAWMVPDGPIPNLTELCERAGILVIPCELDKSLDGVAMLARDLPPCIFLNSKQTADRMRFSLAHELGHIIMHRVPTDTMEDEANAFAAELLVPEKLLLRQAIGTRVTLEFLARQKAYWRVSMAFLLYRLGVLEILTRHQSEYLWKRISALGWRTREPEETDFAPEEASLFLRVIRLHAEDLDYTVDDMARLLKASTGDVRRFYGNVIPPNRRTLQVVK